MRLYIRLSKNQQIIPFNYQHLLAGVIHKWLGKNNPYHGQKSFYSFSWLQNTVGTKRGINLQKNSYFFFSAMDESLVQTLLKGILKEPQVFCGSSVIDIEIMQTPQFSNKENFTLNSPILLKKHTGDKIKHVTHLDNNFNYLLTENLINKLKTFELDPTGASVEIDVAYSFPRIKLVDYNGIKNRTTLAPVIIRGTADQIAFAWNVGLGNSTGIGFGAIK